MRKFKQVRN